MNILVLNAGSSSIKYQLITFPSRVVLCSGMAERIGLEKAQLHYESAEHDLSETVEIPDHRIGLKLIAAHLMHKEHGIIQSADDIDAVGHRVVHGGSSFAATTLINEEVKTKIEELFSLAPLHNPGNLEGIRVSESIFTNAKQVAVFDTAFHQSIPVKAHKYAIPNRFLDEHGIRLYGFHGTSHKYVSETTRKQLGHRGDKLISIHLGNGCSITAIRNGKSVDHSLGFSPMNGLIMGTRSGDIDPSIVFYMMDRLGYSAEEVNRILQKESGMLGLTGFSDLRDIEKAADEGNSDCQLALTMNAYRIQKFIGAYAALMNGLDTIVFTAGIGENSQRVRKMVCENMDFLGIQLDEAKNEQRSKDIREIHSEASRVHILVVPTNEELEIAQQVHDLL